MEIGWRVGCGEGLGVGDSVLISSIVASNPQAVDELSVANSMVIPLDDSTNIDGGKLFPDLEYKIVPEVPPARTFTTSFTSVSVWSSKVIKYVLVPTPKVI